MVIDIVIIELKSHFELKKDLIYPACLPTKAIKTESTSCYTSGWGGTRPFGFGVEPEPWEMADKLQAIRVKPLSKSTCLKTYEYFNATSLFSEGYNIYALREVFM